MIKQIIYFCIIIFGMLIFIEAVAHIFGLIGQIILMVVIFFVPLAYGLSNFLSDEVKDDTTRR